MKEREGRESKARTEAGDKAPHQRHIVTGRYYFHPALFLHSLAVTPDLISVHGAQAG